MRFYIQLLLARNIEQIISIANSYVLDGKLEKIIEITYSYRNIGDQKILNETIFEEYLNLSYPQSSLEYIGRTYKYKIQVQIVYIDDIIARAKKIRILSRNDSLRRGMLVEALEYIKTILEISLLGLPFELEKAGMDPTLSKSDISELIDQIEKKEQKVFGPKVICSVEEFSYCFNFVCNNHITKSSKLSKADNKLMDKALSTIRKQSSVPVSVTPEIKTKYLKGSFLKKEIERKEYRKIFDSVCELYGLPQKTILTNAGSIYDGDNFLEIPKNEAHKTFTIERLLKLLTHEIESHYINTHNGKKLIGSFRGARNLPKEEGLAMFMEKIFHGYNYENIESIVEYFFTTMAGESLDGGMFAEFMRIMGKEYNCKRSYEAAVVRAKRNYPIHYKGVQHKDVVYFRGLNQTIAYLKNGGIFKKLFLGKVGFHDIENIWDIYQRYEKKEELVFPVFISDIIYYYITHKQKDPDFVFKAATFYLYLKKKYWFIGIESFGIIDHINKKWKKIERIIKMVEKQIV